MEIMLLTIVLLYFVWSIAVLVFDADIWLRNKLRIEKPKVEPYPLYTSLTILNISHLQKKLSSPVLKVVYPGRDWLL